ncbi:HipA family kinase [Anaeroselena agilis]|uniref:HipA-like kinase domain-containing protein n=1 Tax=Anaeroselena agilis TaxID=3063788 RepID=A0ABU3P3T8_9FIRM|nr:hypothetical protein [Selenomonadales bacterium 4137-cl]
MLIALEHLGATRRGVTSPQLFRADDGRVYVVKLQNNRLGPKVLANELIAARLGEVMGLCFPPGGMIKLEEGLLKRSRRLAAAGVAPGRHFACRYLSGTEYLCRHNVARAINRSEVAGVMLLDHLAHNLDRTLNRRNLLLRREAHGWRIYAIDNSHFFRRALWTEETLQRLAPLVRVNRHGVYGTLLRYYLRPEDFAPYLATVQGWSDAFLADLVAGVPAEWLPHDGERQAVAAFLAVRRDMAADIVTCLSALIPDNHRAANGDKVE